MPSNLLLPHHDNNYRTYELPYLKNAQKKFLVSATTGWYIVYAGLYAKSKRASLPTNKKRNNVYFPDLHFHLTLSLLTLPLPIQPLQPKYVLWIISRKYINIIQGSIHQSNMNAFSGFNSSEGKSSQGQRSCVHQAPILLCD